MDEKNHEHSEHKHEEHSEKKCCCSFPKMCKGCNKRTTLVASVIAVVLIFAALGWYNRGMFCAAIVNNHCISRLSVMKEAESQSGKAVLDALVAKKLFQEEERANGISVSDAEVNTALQRIADQVKASQGVTLEEALKKSGIELGKFRNDLKDQEALKKLLGDKIKVTNAEIATFLKENKVPVPKGEEALYNERAKDALVQQKISQAISELLPMLEGKASISYFGIYQQ